MTERDAITCCGQRAETHFQALKLWREREFYGSESISGLHRFIPDEVEQKRNLMGKIGHECIRDDGRVVFTRRGEQQEFQRVFDAKVFAVDRQTHAAMGLG